MGIVLLCGMIVVAVYGYSAWKFYFYFSNPFSTTFI
jgi:hypothetical protein